MQRAAQREHARRKRAQTTTISEGQTDERDVEPVVEPLVSSQRQITYAHDVLTMLTRQAHAVEASKSADSLMKARAIAQIATPMLRAIESRDAAIDRTIEERLADLNAEVREACSDWIAQALRAFIEAMPLTPEQREQARPVLRHVLHHFGAEGSESERALDRREAGSPTTRLP